MTDQNIEATDIFLFGQVCRAFHMRVEAMLAEIGVHRGQAMVLCSLRQNEGLIQTELAENLQVRPPTMSNMLKRMDNAGLIERHSDADDRRITRVYMKNTGYEKERLVMRKFEALETELLSVLNIEERAMLRDMLVRLLDKLAEAT